MRLSEDAIDEFAKIYKEEFGEELTKAGASEMAYRLMVFFELLAKRLPSEQLPKESTMPPKEEEPRLRFWGCG